MVASRRIRVFLLLFEATQVLASVTDVGLDILVCYEFYRKERWIAFYSSVLVFALAQAAYAFLFAATYARNVYTSWGRIRAFLIALPLAQLVPLFNWLETFHFKRVDKFLCWLGLNPTGTMFLEDGEVHLSLGAPPSLDEDENALWSFAQQKFRANIGFLVEAIVEAVPQAMIQTCVVVVYGEADLLIVISILMSVFVVASKGYMLSYSIHAETFIFNALCVVADVCGLFATLVWAFAACSAHSLSSSDPGQLYQVWSKAAVAAVTLTWVTGLFLQLFANMDDHLKVLLGPKGRWRCVLKLPTNNVYFDLWVLRSFTWFLALLPASVLVLALKASALPLFHLRTVQPSHFAFPHVNRRMYTFVTRAGPAFATARLFHLNALLRAARRDATAQRYTVSPIYRLAAFGTAKDSKIALRNYVSQLNRARMVDTTGWSRKVGGRGTNDIPTAPKVGEAQVADRKQVRKENRDRQVERELDEFERRSVVWWFIRGAHAEEEDDLPKLGSETETSDSDDDNDKTEEVHEQAGWCGRRRKEWSRSNGDERFLIVGGSVFLVLSALVGVFLVPVLVTLAVTGSLIPLVAPVQWLCYSSDALSMEAALGLVLSGTHLICTGLLVALLPRVAQFQAVVRDVVDFSDHVVLGDDSFYKAGLDAIIEEAYLRYREQLGKDALVDYLETKTNPDSTRRIRAFLVGNERF